MMMYNEPSNPRIKHYVCGTIGFCVTFIWLVVLAIVTKYWHLVFSLVPAAIIITGVLFANLAQEDISFFHQYGYMFVGIGIALLICFPISFYRTDYVSLPVFIQWMVADFFSVIVLFYMGQVLVE